MKIAILSDSHDNLPNIEKTLTYLTEQKVEDSNFPRNYFDFITLNHVLEHMENPLSVLIKLKENLKSGGTTIIHVPNRDSLNSFIFGRFY